MSSAKIWSRRQAEHRRQAREAAAAAEKRQREAAEAVARRRRSRRRRTLTWALGTLVSVALFTVAGVNSTGSHEPAVIAMSAAAGLIVAGSVIVHRLLRPRVGGVTAVLVMSLAGGLLFLTLAVTASQCPDSAAAGRCTGGELANWSMVGMLLPLSGAVMLGIPVLLSRFGFKSLRFLVRLWRSDSGTSNPQDRDR